LALCGHGAQDVGATLARLWVDGDDNAAPVAFVDAKAQAADAQHLADPAILGEGLALASLDQKVGPKARHV
jgi:hypothetical protein